MMKPLLLALAAGAASALMFASILSGALVSVVLFYLSPMPLMVAALAWGPLNVTIGGIAASSALGLLFGFSYLAAFVVSVALPAWWLGQLALRIHAGTDWYPPGRLLLWIAGFATLTTMAALATLGSDSADITAALKSVLARMIRADGADAGGMVDMFARTAPAAAAAIALVTLSLNLWLAGRVAKTSGLLRRPWPDLAATALPPMTMVGLCVALAFCFVGGLPAMAAQVVASALLTAYAITGAATLHTLTSGRSNRALWLSGAYALVLVFGWPLIGLIGLGLADAFFEIRRQRPLSA